MKIITKVWVPMESAIKSVIKGENNAKDALDEAVTEIKKAINDN